MNSTLLQLVLTNVHTLQYIPLFLLHYTYFLLKPLFSDGYPARFTDLLLETHDCTVFPTGRNTTFEAHISWNSVVQLALV